MRILIIAFLWLIFLPVFSQPPAGYYNAAAGLSGENLRIALHNIISNGHQTLSYGDLMGYYQTTDVRPNGKVWDMYSDIPGGTPPYLFTFVTDQCGNYNSEGDCYNREHSVPASWFNDDLPMYADLFHVVPTDGWVNNKRSNYPFGEVNSPTWTSQNGSRLGNNVFSGYSGVVFEPIDSFKGDFARIYFYMATRYKDEISSWSSAMFSGNNLTAYGQNLMYTWHMLDPVSLKETDRNNNVYAIQQNRNPYVDNPQWVTDIWGPSSVFETEEKIILNVFPQPATERIFFSGYPNSDTFIINAFNILGKSIYDCHSDDLKNGLDISSWENGVYIISIKTNGKMFLAKVVKQ